MALTVLVVDDVEVARAGLTSALESRGFDVVAEAASLPEAVRLAAEKKPDVAIVDLRLPDSSGFEIAERISEVSPETKPLFITAHEGDVGYDEISAASSHGLLLKTSPLHELCQAVEEVAAGRPVLDPAFARSLVTKLSPSSRSDPISALTPRERETFDLLARGRSDIEIARSLGISPRTAKNYVARTLQKLGLRRRAQVPAYAAGSSVEDSIG